jgi:hypothetical protein
MKRANIIRLIKIIDIFFITSLYVFVGYYLSKLLDFIFNHTLGVYNNSYSKIHLLLDVLFEMSLTGVFSYLGRNIIHRIPFPLEGYYGFQHLRVKEVSSGALLTTFLVFFQSNLQLKLTSLVARDRDPNYKNHDI